ncbi:MAG TPA: YCF48-related protein [Ignavibacteria bacterium]|nr:YCF48-related protein [Ignavibacteria bacterium]HRF66668.1 YCF48-related protein [Ignavibacteria bacterium]HRJ05553.1 YCF48-related protein [Ignavibacteria bacterium]
MKKILILIVILVNQYLYSQDNWYWLNPYPTANYLTSSQFFNSNTGYVVGARGVFMKTGDAGVTWQYSRIDSLYTDYPELFFLDQNTGFVCINNVWKTTNAGVNWGKINFSEGYGIQCIKFIDQNTGFALANDSGKVYRTTNAGNSWLLTTIPGGKYFSNIAFTGNTAYMIGVKDMIPKLVRSTDLGLNWIDVNMGTNDSMYIDKISIPDNQNLIICGQKGYGFPTKILKSTDAGSTWNLYQMNNKGYFVTDLEFTNAQNGAAVGYEGYRLYTSNGGINWIENRSADSSTIIFDLCKSGSNLVSVGSVGFIERTANTGINWERVSRSFTREHLNSVSFGDANTGLIAGLNRTLFRTTNKGLNWIKVPMRAIYDLVEVKMANSQIAYMTSRNNVLKSTNSGLNWFSVMDSANVQFRNIALYDAEHIIADAGNKLFKSTDGGNNWQLIWQCFQVPPIPTSCFYIQDIAFASPERIIIAGSISQSHNPSNAAMMLSTNGGNSFSVIFNTFSGGFAMSTLYMYDENIGFASGGYGFRLKTNDGFDTFTEYGENTPGFGSFSGFSFIDSLNGLAMGGIIYRTTNGGVNWNFSTSIYSSLGGIEYIDYNTAIGVGSYGTIVRTDGILTGISDPMYIPQRFVLHQNYPNPFNPETSFKYELPLTGYTTLKIYDISGREVKSIVNGIVTEGVHLASSSLTDLASGVYFVQLRQGPYVMSIKIALVK